MAEYHLAQLNISHMKYSMDAPEMAEFVARLEDVNALADRSPGFVWRLQPDDGGAAAIDIFGPEYLVNLSVWQDVESLRDYAFRSAHKDVLARRDEWFERMPEACAVLWWVPAGHVPTLAEAAQRLAQLRQHGPTSRAFTFQRIFLPA